MSYPPPLFPYPDYFRTRDRDHLNLLSVFHFVIGGLGVLGIGFLTIHYAIMSRVFLSPEIWKNAHGTMPPRELFDTMIWFYWAAGGAMVLFITANVICGFFLRKRQRWTFCIVIAGLDCLQIPFGTALGIFTILTLSRESVRQLFEEASNRGNPPPPMS